MKEIKIGNSRVVWNGKSKRYRTKKIEIEIFENVTVSVVNIVCYRFVHSKFRNSFATGLDTGLVTKSRIWIQDFYQIFYQWSPYLKKELKFAMEMNDDKFYENYFL